MRLPDDVTVYVKGKKYVRNIPGSLAPEWLKDMEKSDTKPLKKIKDEKKKDGE